MTVAGNGVRLSKAGAGVAEAEPGPTALAVAPPFSACADDASLATTALIQPAAS
jgi:hypothetical protein